MYRPSHDLDVGHKTITRVYQKLREAIYHVAELEGGKLSGGVKMDESYFGGRHNGKHRRGAADKTIVFGLLERDGKVYTWVVEHVSKEELMAIMWSTDSIIGKRICLNYFSRLILVTFRPNYLEFNKWT